MSQPETSPSPASLPRRYHLKTFGCQMNVYDSERMADALASLGYAPTDDPADADLVLLNTCHIREKAAEKVYSDLGRLKRLKAERQARGAEAMIAVAGCVAQAEGEEIRRRAPVVDLVFGPQSYHRLPDLIARARRGEGAVVDTELPLEDKFEHLPRRTARTAPAAFLTVQEGCDKFCTFCVVPYTRGAESSRPVARLIEEARELAASGVRELTLLGQNVNAYHGQGRGGETVSLAGLIEALSDIDGIERLRYMTSHPRDMTDDLIDAHRANQKLMPYLHLPFQAGSDRILAAMNRKHTAADYLRLVERIREARPDIALSTDIIVGFPGESEEDFEATLRLVEEVGYAQAYTFKYSPRPGTPAAGLAGQVPEAEQTSRLLRLQALIDHQGAVFNNAQIGRMLPVLFEKVGRRPGQIVGRSPYLQPVHVEGEAELIGRMGEVVVTESRPHSLGGVIKAARG